MSRVDIEAIADALCAGDPTVLMRAELVAAMQQLDGQREELERLRSALVDRGAQLLDCPLFARRGTDLWDPEFHDLEVECSLDPDSARQLTAVFGASYESLVSAGRAQAEAIERARATPSVQPCLARLAGRWLRGTFGDLLGGAAAQMEGVAASLESVGELLSSVIRPAQPVLGHYGIETKPTAGVRKWLIDDAGRGQLLDCVGVRAELADFLGLYDRGASQGDMHLMGDVRFVGLSGEDVKVYADGACVLELRPSNLGPRSDRLPILVLAKLQPAARGLSAKFICDLGPVPCDEGLLRPESISFVLMRRADVSNLTAEILDGLD